jgi:hypothetical protein
LVLDDLLLLLWRGLHHLLLWRLLVRRLLLVGDHGLLIVAVVLRGLLVRRSRRRSVGLLLVGRVGRGRVRPRREVVHRWPGRAKYSRVSALRIGKG